MKPSTTPDYDILKDYANYMYNRNLKKFTQNTMSVLDFLSEAFATGFESIDEAKKTIRNSILSEKRRLIARIQQSENRSRFDVREKKCCDCGLPFPIQQFYPRKDKSTGLMYYSSYCTECENKRARAAYAKSNTIKASARRRHFIDESCKTCSSQRKGSKCHEFHECSSHSREYFKAGFNARKNS